MLEENPAISEPVATPNADADSLSDVSRNSTPAQSAVPDEPKDRKIDLVFQPTGDAPILKKKKWTVCSSKTIGWVINFLRKFLKISEGDTLFLYVNQSFGPSPDESIQSLYDCFGADNKLTLNYCLSQAWG